MSLIEDLNSGKFNWLIGEPKSEVEILKEEIAKLKAACAAKDVALKKYGQCRMDCALQTGEYAHMGCTCGLKDALKSDCGREFIEALNISMENLEHIRDVCNDEIKVRSGDLPEWKLKNMRVISLLIIPRNMAANALEKARKALGIGGLE